MNGNKPHDPGATGIAAHQSFKLQTRERRELQRIVKKHAPAGFEIDRFAKEFEASVARYLSISILGEKSSAKNVRENLKRAIEAAHKLQKALDSLDGNSLQLVSRYSDGRLGSKSSAIMMALLKARSYAEENFKKHGPRSRPERLHLAADLRDALRDNGAENLSAAEGGLFEVILKLAFWAADKKEYEDLHSLAGEALKKTIKFLDQGVPVYDASE